MIIQKDIRLPPKKRGCYLITDHILKELPELKNVKTGLLSLFIQHTSAGLTLNENWDPTVRSDLNNALNDLVPDDPNEDRYEHSQAGEGPDDMAGHIKSTLVGASVSIPVKDGRLRTGTWQGIYLCEFRDYTHTRTVIATLIGE